MEDMPKIRFKGSISEINAVFTIWNRKIKHTSICYKESLEELEQRVNVPQTILEKVNLINRLDKETFRLLAEEETGEKIKRMKLVRVIFDFAEPEDGDCSVDLYLHPGRVLGGFNVHFRLHGEEPRIEVCGLSA